jgi:hypothetical protein
MVLSLSTLSAFHSIITFHPRYHHLDQSKLDCNNRDRCREFYAVNSLISSPAMTLRAKQSVVVTYGHSGQTPNFICTPPSPMHPPSIDSGIGLDDKVYPSAKLQGVVVTVPRRRFIRSKEPSVGVSALSQAQAQPAESRSGSTYCDFILYPSADSRRSPPAAQGPTPPPTPTDEWSASGPASTPAASQTADSKHPALFHPPKPLPPRLPTPDIPEVDESSWWAK